MSLFQTSERDDLKLEIILASASPRRKELLGKIIKDFTIEPSDADETLPDEIAADKAVEMLALKKAEAVFVKHKESVIIGADTVVVYDGKILGKPTDRQNCLEMMDMLSGKTHEVYTGIAIITPNGRSSFTEKTEVTFAEMSQEEKLWYISLDEPYDKAGGYGIQGEASLFIKGIKGDYFNVMGLPVNSLYQYIKKMKINSR